MMRRGTFAFVLSALVVAAACGTKGSNTEQKGAGEPAVERSAQDPAKDPARARPTPATGDPEMMKQAPRISAEGPAPDSQPAVKPISADVVMVGDVRVDLKAKRVEAPAQIMLAEGILEFVAVSKGGKTYESVLVVEVPPFHVQMALLMAGFKEGDAIGVSVKLPSGDEAPVTTLLDDRGSDEPVEEAWRFTGSPVEQGGRLAADMTGSVIAIWPDPTAIVNATRERGNPYRGENQGLAVASTNPPVGTKVTLVFHGATK
jgi:hypothetical protein